MSDSSADGPRSVSSTPKRGRWSWTRDRTKLWLVAALAMMIVGAFVAREVNTDFGSVNVTQTTIYGTNGYQISAYIYTPSGVSATKPAPAIVVWHGLNNQKDFMDYTALELARRGYVVVSADQTGHGESTGYDTAGGCGGPDVLAYTQTLTTVNAKKISLLGMSQGGFCAATAAALSQPKAYQSIFYMESEPQAPGGAPDSTPYLGMRNVAFNIGRWTELGYMIAVPKGNDAEMSPELMPIFGTRTPIVKNKIYGSIADGTARILYTPWEDHALSTISPGAIKNAISWMEQTNPSNTTLSASDQIWEIMFIATCFTVLGAFIFLFTMGGLLLRTEKFGALKRPLPAYRGLRGKGWWIGALLTTAIGPALYFWVFKGMFFSTWVAPSTLWPQTFTNIYMVWSLIVGAITWVLLAFNHFAFFRKQGATLESYGVAEPSGKINWRDIWTSFQLALLVLLPIYVILVFVHAVWHVDFRSFFVNIDPLTPARWLAFFGYLAPFAFYFIAQGINLGGFLRWKGGDAPIWQEMLVNSIVLTLGALVWTLINYLPILFGGTSPLAGTNNPESSISAGMGGIYYWPLLFLWPLCACLYTWYFRKTGRVFVGILIVTLFMVWTLAASGDFGIWPAIG